MLKKWIEFDIILHIKHLQTSKFKNSSFIGNFCYLGNIKLRQKYEKNEQDIFQSKWICICYVCLNFQKNLFAIIKIIEFQTWYCWILVISPNNSVLGYKLLQNKSAHKGLNIIFFYAFVWMCVCERMVFLKQLMYIM